MTHYSAPLLIAATMYLMTLPAPALAHGLSSVAATFILLFLALALVAPTLTDVFVSRPISSPELSWDARSYKKHAPIRRGLSQLGEAHCIAILRCDRCVDAMSVRGQGETRAAAWHWTPHASEAPPKAAVLPTGSRLASYRGR
jgi:hypothetical protein